MESFGNSILTNNNCNSLGMLQLILDEVLIVKNEIETLKLEVSKLFRFQYQRNVCRFNAPSKTATHSIFVDETSENHNSQDETSIKEEFLATKLSNVQRPVEANPLINLSSVANSSKVFEQDNMLEIVSVFPLENNASCFDENSIKNLPFNRKDEETDYHDIASSREHNRYDQQSASVESDYVQAEVKLSASKKEKENNEDREKRFCSVCNRLFLHGRYLKTHKCFPNRKRSHAFSFQGDLNSSKRIATRKKPFECVDCGKFFATKAYVKLHAKLHTTSKPFRCDTCGKCYALKASLKQHEQIHACNKSFACPFCEKVYHWKSGLKTHLRIHTGEKPYQCKICGNHFKIKAMLRRHVCIQ